MVSLFGKKPAAGDGSVPATGGSVLGSTTVAWDDANKQNNVMWKVPRNIRLNDNIVVREDEIAVFYRDGKVLTYFDQPNRYALTDFNAPVVGSLLKYFTGVVQDAEVYYLQKRYMDGKFGSTQPYQFTDPTFGIVSLRVFGEYRWRVSSPENFINQFVGTFSAETSSDVEDRLKEQMVILVYNALGKMKAQGLKVTDLAGNLTNVEQMVLATS
ncbi:MAG: SPFH domain-containing protein, partial [Nitrososphaerales archaeon]